MTWVTRVALGAALGAAQVLSGYGVGAASAEAPKEDAKKVPNAVGGGYIAYPNRRGMALFSHLSHQDAGLRCEDCHPGVFPMKRGSFTMKDLYAKNACGKCHDGEMKAPKDEKRVAQAAGMCNACHAPLKPITYAPEKAPAPAAFSHDRHTAASEKEIGAGYACGACHPKPFARKAGAMKMPAPHTTMCATCHDGKTVSPQGKIAPAIGTCTLCHAKQEPAPAPQGKNE